jgi:hypothetical protein
MPDFVLTYRNPTGYKPSPESMAAWMAWFEGMGDHLVEQGKPTVVRSALGDTSAERTELGGYSLIQADDLESAVAVAKGCPHLDRGGGVEIGQLGEVPEPPATGRRASG